MMMSCCCCWRNKFEPLLILVLFPAASALLPNVCWWIWEQSARLPPSITGRCPALHMCRCVPSFNTCFSRRCMLASWYVLTYVCIQGTIIEANTAHGSSQYTPTDTHTYVLNTQAYRSDAHTYVTSSQYTSLLMNIQMSAPRSDSIQVCWYTYTCP